MSSIRETQAVTNVLAIAGDSLTAMLHRRWLLAVMIVAFLVTVVFYVVFGQMSQQALLADPSGSEASVRALADAQLRAVQSQIRLVFGIYCEICVVGGVMLAVLVGAISMSSEFSKGPLGLILAKPVSRWQLLFGRYLGAVIVLVGYFVFMGSALAIYTVAHELVAFPAAWSVPWFAFCQFLILSSLTVVLTTVMHSNFAALLAFYSYLAWSFQVLLVDSVFYNVYYALPSFGVYSVRNQFVNRAFEFGWYEVGILTLYAVNLTVIFLLLALWRLHYKKVN